jgi:hypothetical protein
MPETFPVTPPAISAEFAADTLCLAKQIEADYPNSTAWQEHAAFLRASIAGLAPPPVVDTRTPQQQHYDKAYGLDGDNPPMPDALAAIIDRDTAAAKPHDPDKLTAQLDAAGRSYADDLAAAQSLVGADKAKSLSAHTLAQIGIWAAHRARHAANRPKG